MKAYKIAWAANSITRQQKVSPFKALHNSLREFGLQYKGRLSAMGEIVVAIGNRRTTALLTLHGNNWVV